MIGSSSLVKVTYLVLLLLWIVNGILGVESRF